MSYISDVLLDYILFTCTLYICKISGILPCKAFGKHLTLEEILKNTTGIKEDLVAESSSFPTNGAIYILTHTSITVLWCIFCKDTSSPGHYELLILEWVAAYMLVIYASFRRVSIMKCIKMAARVYFMSSTHHLKQQVIFLSLLLPALILFFGLIVSFTHELVYGSLSKITSLPLLGCTLLICSLCVVCERAYIHIDTQLSQLISCSPRTINQLEVLIFQFELVTDVIGEIIHCFGPILATILTEFTLHLVLLTYYLSRFPPDDRIDSKAKTIVGFSILALHSIKFFTICKSSQQIQNQVKSIALTLQNLRVHWVDIEDDNLQTMISDFSDSINSTTVVLSAAGFTEINLSLLFKLIGTATMYASAAIGISTSSGQTMKDEDT